MTFPSRKAPVRRSAGFTMIEVLTVAAIAVIILALTVPAFGWMTDARDRERVRETIGAQVMSARALAVQNRTYVGVMVRNIDYLTAGSQCAMQRSGLMRIIWVVPEAASDAIWNKSFCWFTGRGPSANPNGVGFLRGYKPTAGTAIGDLTECSTFFIVFGPDGVLRDNWEVQYVYGDSGGTTGEALMRADRSSNNRTNATTQGARCVYTARPCRFSVRCFAVYDFRGLTEESGGDTRALDVGTSTNPAGLLTRLYTTTGINALVRDDVLCRRTFLNPYTGLGITELDQINPLTGSPYKELEP